MKQSGSGARELDVERVHRLRRMADSLVFDALSADDRAVTRECLLRADRWRDQANALERQL